MRLAVCVLWKVVRIVGMVVAGGHGFIRVESLRIPGSIRSVAIAEKPRRK